MVPNLVPDEPILRLPREATVWPVRVKALIEPAPKLKLLEKRLVEEAVVLKKFVVVAEVPVALVKSRFVLWILVPVTCDENRLVVVAEVPVALTKVKFCKVLEALSKRFARVPRPVEVKLPPFPVVKNKLVELAVVEKRLVVVAAVPVAFTKVKFCKVLEALSKRFARVPRPVEVKLPPLPVVKNKFVDEAVVDKRFVVVALVAERSVTDKLRAPREPSKAALPTLSMVTFLALMVSVSSSLPRVILPPAEKLPETPSRPNKPPLPIMEL